MTFPSDNMVTTGLELLPTICAVGDTFEVCGKVSGGMWTITQSAGQSIVSTATSTTVGVLGTLTGVSFDAVKIVCNTANLTFTVVNVRLGL